MKQRMWCAPRKQTMRCQHALKGQMFGLKQISLGLCAGQVHLLFLYHLKVAILVFMNN